MSINFSCDAPNQAFVIPLTLSYLLNSLFRLVLGTVVTLLLLDDHFHMKRTHMTNHTFCCILRSCTWQSGNFDACTRNEFPLVAKSLFGLRIQFRIYLANHLVFLPFFSNMLCSTVNNTFTECKYCLTWRKHSRVLLVGFFVGQWRCNSVFLPEARA